MSTLLTPQRPTSSKPPAPDPEVTQIRQQYAYLRDSILLAGLGVAGYGAAPLLGAGSMTSWAIAGGCTTMAAITYTHGHIKNQRTQISDRCRQALEPLMGKGLLSIRLTKWAGPFSSTPGQIALRYAPGQPDNDPQWSKQISTALAARTGLAFKITHIDRKRCRARLEIDNTPAAQQSAQAKRTEALITDLIPTAVVDRIITNDLGEPIRIEASHHAAHKLAAKGYQNRVARTVSASLPGRWRARWDTQNDTVVFEIRPDLPSSMWVKPLAIDAAVDPLKTYRQVRIPYAVDEDGNIMEWAPAIDPHFMCVGPTGSGKTSTEHNILETIAQYIWPIWVADGKGIEFLGFKGWPNVQIVGSTTEEHIAIIHRAWQVMEQRYQLIIKGLAREEDFEPLMVFIDEWADMRTAIANFYARNKTKGSPSRCPVFDDFESIARKGRTSRVHLLVSLQRPDVDLFGKGESRDNFRCRVSMGRLSAQGAQMMWGDPSAGVAMPIGKPGRGITISPDNRIVEVLCFRAPDPRKAGSDPEQMEILKTLVPKNSVHKPLKIDTPILDDLDCEEGQEPTPPSYWDFAEAPWSETTITSWDVKAVEFTEEEAARARLMSAPSTILGVGLPQVGKRNGPVVVSHISDRDSVEEQRPEAIGYDEIDPFEGYGPATAIPASRVQLGDMVLIDPEIDHWAVVDGDPDDDLGDDECIAIPWRDDADEDGMMSIPHSESVMVRRLLEENE